jgi:uncharacterized Zn finger protein
LRRNKASRWRDEGDWPQYVSAEERRAKAARAAANLRKKGQELAPVVIAGSAIAKTFWGKAWCENLESYHDFANRLQRGRSYVRQGAVVDLQVGAREIRALVSGTSVYSVRIGVTPVPEAQWKALCADCGGAIASLIELLQGRLSKPVMERLCRQDGGLFPKPGQISFSCSCPDSASMCKHVAAVLYGVGARFDDSPALLFVLRDVDQNDLIGNAGPAASGAAPKSERILADTDVAELFGLDMEAVADAASAALDTATERPRERVSVSDAIPAAPTMSVAKKKTDPKKIAAKKAPAARQTAGKNAIAGKKSATKKKAGPALKSKASGDKGTSNKGSANNGSSPKAGRRRL